QPSCRRASASMSHVGRPCVGQLAHAGALTRGGWHQPVGAPGQKAAAQDRRPTLHGRSAWQRAASLAAAYCSKTAAVVPAPAPAEFLATLAQPLAQHSAILYFDGAACRPRAACARLPATAGTAAAAVSVLDLTHGF